LFPDVDGEQGSEKRGVGGKGAKSSGAEAGPAVEQEQEASHAVGQIEQDGVARCVRVKSRTCVTCLGE
jgi:hypothetical protein